MGGFWAQWVRDWPLKLFSLGVAVALYLYVSTENTSSVEVDFRLDYLTADEMMLSQEPQQVLHVTLQGPGATFRSLDISDLRPVVVNLKQAEPGVQRQVIDSASIKPPTGMRVVAVRPSEIEINLDRRVERLLPIRPDLPEGPAAGFEVVDITLTPPRARVVGPAGKMQALDAIVTRPIEVAGREESLEVEVALRPPFSPLKLLDRQVRVFVEIGEEFVQRSVTQVPVRIIGPPRAWQLSHEMVTLLLRGPRRTLDQLNAGSLGAYVELPAADEPGVLRLERPVTLPGLPERTQLAGPLPKVVLERPAPKRARRRP